MIRIKVIKGSQLALGAVAVLLVIVLAVLAIRMMAVSYTHLDVYKRQGPL